MFLINFLTFIILKKKKQDFYTIFTFILYTYKQQIYILL